MADGWSLLLSLPSDVLENIVLSPGLSFVDISSLCRTCWTLHNVVSRMWPRLAAVKWCRWGELKLSTQLEWFQLCKERFLCETQCNKALRELTLKGVRTMITDEDDLECLSAIVENCSPDVLIFVLDEILNDRSDLTCQFYALYCKEKAVRLTLLQKWKELFALPVEQQPMEKGAVLFTQWMNPCASVSMSAIGGQLDQIAEQAATELMRSEGEREPDSKCAELDIVGVLLARKLAPERVLDCLNDVLFSKLGFKGASADRYYDLENSYIDKVLESKVGIPISLCMVYSAVARRLGVSLQPLNFPRHFVLKLPKGGRGDDDVIIDVFERGRRLSTAEFLTLMTHTDQYDSAWKQFLVPTEPVNVFKRMVANVFSNSQMTVGHSIERIIDKETGKLGPLVYLSALTLRLTLCMLTPLVDLSLHDALYSALIFNEHFYSPCTVERVLSHMSVENHSIPMYENRKLMDLIRVARDMAEKKQALLDSPAALKQRPLQLLYSVGMIMKHRMYNYNCVIYGWDLQCEMSEGWILQMGVDRLPRKRHQPFYNVLVMDGSNRYAAEDNLVPCPANEAGPVTHWEVGKYFCKFLDHSYTPNFALRQLYPEDNNSSPANDN